MILSVVINTYGRPQALAQCLKALAEQEGCEPFEVVVVDDSHQGGLEPFVNQMNIPYPLRLVWQGHGGRSVARNRGVAAAQGRRVLFLGDDVMLQPQAVARHQACTDPMVAVVGPYPWKGLKGSPPFMRWAEPNPQEKITDPQNAGFQFFATGNLSMDRETFDRLGCFDPRYKVYGWEDIDLGLRFERSGGRVVFDAQAAGAHEHPQMSLRALLRREYQMGITAWQYADKWSKDRAAVDFMKFWDDAAALRPGPRWRRVAGRALLGLLDRIAPGSGLNWRAYERLIFAYRLAGVAHAWRRWGMAPNSNGAVR